VRGFVVAVRYLTIVPLPGAPALSRDTLGGAGAWFPVVGLGVGAVVAATDWLWGRLFPPLLGALLTVTVWKLLTGGLHLDGLADSLDGLGGRDPAHRLAVMRDGRIGAFGAVGLILFLLLEVAAVAELAAGLRWRTLIAVPALARALPLLIARLFPSARKDGHEVEFRASLRPGALPLGLTVAVLVPLGLLGPGGGLAIVAAAAAALALAAFLARRLCGITGDVLGAAVEIGELAALLAVVAWAHGRP
jgi:adenosylcobinamide-GDP ribazoletransferase